MFSLIARVFGGLVDAFSATWTEFHRGIGTTMVHVGTAGFLIHTSEDMEVEVIDLFSL
ncbi:MAG TPA: hypothetical protein VIG33_05680 [Pseudobdellovibrionaceae bacterium]